MREYLTVLLPFQRLYIPALLLLAMWAIWRTVVRRDPAVGLGLYIGLVVIVDGFLNTGVFVPGFAQGSIRYSEICAAFLLLNRPPPGARHWSYSVIRGFAAIYFGLLLVSTFSTVPVIAGVFEFRREIVPQIISFLVAVRGLRSLEDFRRFFLTIMALAVAIALFVFWDLFFDRWLIFSDMLNKPEYFASRKQNRFGAFFLNPNYLGTFTVLVFPAAFAWAMSEKKALVKAAAGVGLLALAFCLVETQSRGSLLAFGATLPLLLFGPTGGGMMTRTRRLAVFVPLALAFTMLMPGFYERATKRFETIEEEIRADGRTRQTTWQYTFRIIGNNPIGGLGYGEAQYIRTMEDYGYTDEFGRAPLHHPHNAYLQMATYAGIPALLAFLAANGLLLLQGLLAMRTAEEYQPITLGFVVGIITFLVVIYPHNHMFVEELASVYWVFFGLLVSLATKARYVAPVVVTSAFFGPGQQFIRRPAGVAQPASFS